MTTDQKKFARQLRARAAKLERKPLRAEQTSDDDLIAAYLRRWAEELLAT